MKFPKLDLVCANDEIRPVMECVMVYPEFTYASDAHICVKHRTSELFLKPFVESIPEEGILIPRRAIMMLRQKMTLNVSLSKDKKQIQLSRSDGSVISYKLYISDRKYPDADKIIPNKKDCKPLSEIALKSSLLLRLADGLGTDTSILHLIFFEPTRAILCDCNGNGDYISAIGVIMPVMMRE